MESPLLVRSGTFFAWSRRAGFFGVFSSYQSTPAPTATVTYGRLLYRYNRQLRVQTHSSTKPTCFWLFVQSASRHPLCLTAVSSHYVFRPAIAYVTCARVYMVGSGAEAGVRVWYSRSFREGRKNCFITISFASISDLWWW